MKKTIFVILMCVAKFATAQEINPLVPYKSGKANHSVIEMEQKLNDNPSIVKNWGAVLERAAWRDGWAHEVSPEFFQEEKYIVFCLRKSFQVKKNFQKGDFATFGTKSDGTLVSTERDPYSGELFLELDPNDLETETFRLSKDYPPVTYASSVCMNGVDVYAKQVSSSEISPTPRLNRNNDGYSQVAPSEQPERYAEPEFRQEEASAGNTYITNNYYDGEQEVVFDQNERGYVDERAKWYFEFGLQLNVGPHYANTHCGNNYVGQSYGHCNHGQPYQQFAYQPAGGGNPQNINIEIINQISNVNTNTNTNTNTTTVTTDPGNPPGDPDPIDPPNGGDEGEPLDPPNGRNVGKNVFDEKNNYANHQPGGQNAQSVNHSRATTPTKTEQSDPRPMNPAVADSRSLTNSSATASANNEISIPRPMKPSTTADSRPKTNSSSSTTVADSRPSNSSRPNPSASSAKPESKPSQKPANYFMRGPQQDQPQAKQSTQSRPAANQNQTRTTGSPQSRPQAGNGNYNQGSRKSSNVQPTQQSRSSQPTSRPSYGNSSPSRQTAYNTGQPNRGSAPTGGRGNSGGGNYGGQRR